MKTETEYELPFFEWDEWSEAALKNGMDPELADLGRAVHREASQHNWPQCLRVVCQEPDLNDILLRAPIQARQFYETMLATDGFKYVFPEGDAANTDMIELCNL